MLKRIRLWMLEKQVKAMIAAQPQEIVVAPVKKATVKKAPTKKTVAKKAPAKKTAPKKTTKKK